MTRIPSKPRELRLKKGDFDLTGYELVRSQFMTSFKQVSVTISSTSIQFNKGSIDKLPNDRKIELLVLPEKRMFGIRKAPPNSRYALEWSKKEKETIHPKPISGSAFLPTLYQLFGWNKENKYMITGTTYRSDNDIVIIYDTKDAILLLSQEIPEHDEETEMSGSDVSPKKRTKRIKAYPSRWADSFGENYYNHTSSDASASKEWIIESSDSIYRTDTENVTTQTEAAEHIKQILNQLGDLNE